MRATWEAGAGFRGGDLAWAGGDVEGPVGRGGRLVLPDYSDRRSRKCSIKVVVQYSIF